LPKLRQIFEFCNLPRKLVTNLEVYISGQNFCCKSFFLHIFALLVSRDTFVPTKIVLKVGFLEHDFGGKKLLDKNGPKNTLWCIEGVPLETTIIISFHQHLDCVQAIKVVHHGLRGRQPMFKLQKAIVESARNVQYATTNLRWS
jgi:hypothetical protein